MYLVAEPTPAGFRPQHGTLRPRRDRDTLDHGQRALVNAYKDLIVPNDGLADLQMVLTVELYPMTFAQPHSHIPGCEEVWVLLSGDGYVLLGKNVRKLEPGLAYLIPPNDKVPHANFNVSEKPIKFFYFARFQDHAPRK